MLPPRNNPPPADSQSDSVVLLFFAIGFVVALLSAVIFFYFATSGTHPTYGMLAWSCVGLAAVFGAGGWWARHAPIRSAALVATWSAVALICLISIGLDEGVHALSLGYLGVIIYAVCVVVSVRAGLVMAALCSLWLLAITYGETVHWVRGAEAFAHSPFHMRVITLLLMVSTAYAVGLMVARILDNHLRAVGDGEVRFRALFDQLPAGLLLQRDGEILEVNRAGAALLGPGTPALRDALRAHAAPLDVAPVGAEQPPERVVVAGEDGEPRALQVSARRVESDAGPITLTMFVDDTARHRAEREDKRAQAQLLSLFDASPDAIMVNELDGRRIMVANKRFLDVTGRSEAEVIGNTVLDLGLWDDPADLVRFRDSLLKEGHALGVVGVFVVRDGERREMHTSASVFEIDGERYVVTFASDMTQLDQLRREQEAILASASLGIALTYGMEVTQANEACRAMFGTPPDAVSGASVLLVWDPDDAAVERTQDLLREHFARGESVDIERRLVRADGTRFMCRMRGSPVDPRKPQFGGVVWVLEDVTERRRMEDALAAARDAAESASRAKSAFLANTTHEIRTPLNGLIGLARLAMKPRTDDVQKARYLRQILDCAENLGEIMGSVLDLSKIESGQLSLEETNFDPRALLRALHATYATMAELRELGCELRIADDVPAALVGDPTRLRQIVGNFVANALKFTEHGGIAIEATSTPRGALRVAVRDSGIGIDAATLERLFQPFMQADGSTTRRFGGTGLGLSICRELATLMGGTVGAESTPGVGSCFWAELPLRAVPAATPGAGVPALAAHEADGLRDRLVLVVEDNPVNMVIAVALLEDLGMRVAEASDGAEAVRAVDAAAAAGAPFDLVLMDIQMPVLDGFGATRVLRTRYDARVLPIVALTAGALVAEREEALACGMNAFLTKPIDEGVFRRTLVSALGSSPLGSSAEGSSAEGSSAAGSSEQGSATEASA